jgi:hypothetical protein
MTTYEFFRRVMTEHWDMVRCYCPICEIGRDNGLSGTYEHLAKNEDDPRILAVAQAMSPYLDGVKKDKP